MFQLYFSKTKDIGDETVLTSLGKKYGINEKEIQEYLSKETNIKKINDMDIAAKKMGITGVPFYVFNDQISLSGAQPVETLMQAIQKSSNG